MYPQAIEIASLTGDVASERSSVLFQRIKPAALDADVLTRQHRERVYRVGSLFGVPPLEKLGQQRKEPLPEFGIDSVQPMVEAALADHLWHVSVLVEEAAGLVDVATEEGGGYQGEGHQLSGREPNLGIVVEAAHGLQEVGTQTVEGGYWIVPAVLLL